MAAESFITQLLQLGVGGIDLKRALDMISPLRLARMTNVVRDEEGMLQLRPGQRRLAWAAGAKVHSLARLQAALEGGEFIRVAGVDGSLYAGQEGALAKIEDGFSGRPLSFVQGHPPISGDSWLYVGDSAKMVKVRGADKLVLPIGMRAPAAPVVAVVGSDNACAIDNFEAAGWTNNAGTGGTPANALSSSAKQGAYSVAFSSAVGSATGAYYNFWGKANVRDASFLSGIIGNVDATDDDQAHLFMKMDKPARIDEVRIYFVISDDFDATALPGTDSTKNTNAYVKTFIPSQFTPLVEAESTANSVLQEAVQSRLLEEAIAAAVARTGSAQTAEEQAAEARLVAEKRFALGRSQWTEFGTAGIPLRRAEFLRIGSDIRYDWSTIKGLIIYVSVNAAEAVVVNLDDLYFRGGYKPDSSDPTSVGYDWRVRHWDPRTGAKSRFSPTMTTRLDLVRQNARITPEAYGDPAVRQEFYRRGGTIPTHWYFVGVNRSDGGCGKDNMSDAQALAAGFDNDDDYHQPVSTVDRDGEAVYGQPIPVIFGPLNGILFGLGDPNRPGHVYWTLPDEYDHWPVYANAEVCSPDEELMNGGVFGGAAFCFSRERLYPLYVSIADASVKAGSSTCARGLAVRDGMVVGLDAIYFVSQDGIWKTSGSVPTSLSEDYIEPLFRGQSKNGYAPIDWAASGQIRLSMHRNELWFTFQDTDGLQQVWIYSLIFGFWRHFNFAWPVSAMLSESYGQPQFLLGSAATGRIYVHDSSHDDGRPIAANIRTGALHMGMPRLDKLFGDLELEADLKGQTLTVTVYKDREGQLVKTTAVVPQAGLVVYLIDAFGTTPLVAKDVSIDLAWSALGVSPTVGRGGPSFVPQPESSIGRITEWDELGGPANKLLKGILIEADTFGFLKTLQVMVDGSNVAAPGGTFTLQTSGRQFVHVVFDQQIDARVVRLVPADVSPWIPYEVRWMFDSDPLSLTKWETQPTDHGVHASHTLGGAWVTMKATTPVTLTVTATRANGSVTTGTVTIPATAGEKRKQFVKLPCLSGVLFRYAFTSTVAHRLYREESKVEVYPWGSEQPLPVQPFGTDNLDIARIVGDAEGVGVKGQRWLDTSVKAGQS